MFRFNASSTPSINTSAQKIMPSSFFEAKKNSDDVVIREYLRCGREGKTKSDEESFNKRISDFIRLINCLLNDIDNL